MPYLTEHQSLAEYAKKSELPTKTSQLTNDSGFLTEHQDLSEYATKAYSDSNLNTAKDYADDNLVTAKEYSNANLATAKSYTDTSISNLTWTGTQSEYDALEVKSANTIYMIIE